MPRRYADYGADDGFTTLNQVSTVSAFLLAASTLPFLWNVYQARRSPTVPVDDPWGWGRSLEWATSCPPPRHNFETLPRIRSESPAFDLHHPEIAALEYEDNPTLGESGAIQDAPDMSSRGQALGQDVPDERNDNRTDGNEGKDA
jgi:cytochrome c oxidase subunit 1